MAVPLQPGEIRVWSVLTTPGSGGAQRISLLSATERGRADRLAGDADRNDYINAHVLLRRALSDCVPGTTPAQWSFVSTPEGKPEVVDRRQHADVRFSLSHSRGVVVCAVTTTHDCGVDVEPIDASGALPRRRVLTSEESAMLESADKPDVAELYARLWTLKEAYGKARGLGLLLPFDKLNVTLGDPPAVDDRTLAPSGAGADDTPHWDTGHWHAIQWLPTDRHVAAVVTAGAVAGVPPDVVLCTDQPE